MKKLFLILFTILPLFGAQTAERGLQWGSYPLDTSIPTLTNALFQYWDADRSSNKLRTIHPRNALMSALTAGDNITLATNAAGKVVITGAAGGGSVSVNGVEVEEPNLENTATISIAVDGSDVNFSIIEAGVEALLDLPDLQGQISDAQIADGAIDGGTGGEIADGSITAADLGADSVAASELDAAAVESELEGVLDLQDMQGAVTDAQVPNNITVDLATLATTATTANAGDSATAFFSAGEIEIARLPSELLTLTEGDAAYVPLARTISAGNGMSGGGDLSANRTLTWAPSAWTSATVGFGDSSQSSIAWTFNLSGATDPAWTYANNSASLNVPLSITSLATSGDVLMGAATYFGFNGRAFMKSPSANAIHFVNVGDTLKANITAGTLTLTPAAADTAYATYTGGSVTGSAVGPLLSYTGTMNTSGNATYLDINVTNTAWGSSGKIVDFRIGGSTVAQVRRDGAVIGAYLQSGNEVYLNGGNGVISAPTSTTLKMTDNTGAGFGTLLLGHDDSSPNSATVRAATGSGTDIAGGTLNIAGGSGTGTGKGGAVALRTSPFSTTGSSANTAVDRYIVAPEITLTDAATSVFEVALPTLRAVNLIIRWGIEASDASDVQAYGGVTVVAAVNKAGTYTKTITTTGTQTEAKAVSAGTQTAAWSIVDGTNKITLQFTPNGSLTETTYRLYFTIENNSRQAITLL